MIPGTIDESTASSAERKVFELLKRDPATTDWLVLHSLGLARRGAKPYGEIDFVVLVPLGGVFCLEIKGGRIACHDGEWETIDRVGRAQRLKRSPFLQAREGMFAVRDAALKRAEGLNNVLFGYAVVMPDVAFDQQSPEWESWQVLDRNALGVPISIPIMKLANRQRALHRQAESQEP
jgi:hypothetical protein